VDVTRQLVDFVDNLRVGVLGAVGLAGLFLTVISLIEKVESAFNHIWRVRRPRSYGRMFSDYLSVVLVGPVLVFTALGLIASAESHWLVQRLLAIPLGTWIQPVAQRIVPFTFLCVAFTFLYRVIPNTRVPLVSALVGGAAGAFLWQLAGIAFASLLANSPSYVGVYSGFAVLVLFLMWLQFAWLVLLVGAIVAYVHQHPSAYQLARLHRSHLFRERTALGALAEVTRRHLAGERPVGLADLAHQLNAPHSLMEDLLDAFVRRGVLLRSAEPDGVALARPPERVTVTEVLQIVRDPDGTEPAQETLSAVSEALRLRDRAARTALDGLTLHTLAEGSSALLGEAARPELPERAA
jgi:membrane protein